MNCRYCGSTLKPIGEYCTKCGKYNGNSSGASRHSKLNIFLCLHTLLSIGYLVCQGISFINQANSITSSSDPFIGLGNALLLGIGTQLLKPHLIIIAISTVFSLIGFFFKRPWAYMTSAIIQSIAIIAAIALIFSNIIWLGLLVALNILGYISYGQLKKQNV